MLKSKLCGFTIACLAVILSISPVTAYAAEAGTQSVTLSENEKDHKEKRAAFEKKLKEAREKWSKLSDRQKNEIYNLLEDELQSKFCVIDKLADFDVIGKEEAEFIKYRMQKKYDKEKQSGEFPLFRMKGKKADSQIR